MTKQERWERYYRMLTEWNQKFNLTAITEKNEVYVKHFEDSLLGAFAVPQGASLCDVGSGAGFPGVPLKIEREDIRLTLLDSLQKRIGFLQALLQELRLSGECLHMRAEEAGKGSLRESFDVVTARAVARMNTLAEYCLPLVRVGGVFLAYKAVAKEELAESARALELLGGKLREERQFTLSDGEQRTIIVVEKVKPTPKAYPRGKNKERTQPIV